MGWTLRARTASASLALVLTSGCCDLSRWLCGPDDSMWVSVDYRSPERALRTFLEAIRRDNVRVIAESLSPGFLARQGLDRVGAAVAWQRLQDAWPGLHLLGSTEVPEPVAVTPTRTLFVLERGGHRLRVTVSSTPFVAVRYLDPEVGEQEFGEYLEPTERLASRLEVSRQESSTVVSLRHAIDNDELPTDFDPSRVIGLCADTEWKIDDITRAEEAEPGATPE